MKKSYYNFIFPGEDGKSVLYNSRTGAMAELDKEHTEQLENLSEQELEEQSPEFANALLINGFAVEDGVSELDMIRYDMWKARYGNRSLHITIAPTQECNFGCQYCYEKEVLEHKFMDIDTQDAIIKYIDQNVIKGEKLSVTWYGGEPLLAIDIIERMSKAIFNICREKEIEYSANIITNGYLLTDACVEKLVACNVKRIQVTLDGEEDCHNIRRPLRNGAPTYSKIWNNIVNLKGYRKSVKVLLRINVDKTNQAAIEIVKKQVCKENLDDYVHVYPGKVVPNGSCYKKEVCYTNKEFAELEQKFICNQGEQQISKCYPRQKHINCMAENNRAILFNAEGNMYKCLSNIGKAEWCIGNIKTQNICNEQVLYQYLLRDVTDKKECKECKVLPICMGGCPYAAYEGKETCEGMKYTLERYMKYFPYVMREK